MNNKCYPLAINYIETDYSKDSKPYNLDILVFQLRNHLYHKETLKQHCLCVLIELVKKYGDQIRTQLNQLEASDAVNHAFFFYFKNITFLLKKDFMAPWLKRAICSECSIRFTNCITSLSRQCGYNAK